MGASLSPICGGNSQPYWDQEKPAQPLTIPSGLQCQSTSSSLEHIPESTARYRYLNGKDPHSTAAEIVHLLNPCSLLTVTWFKSCMQPIVHPLLAIRTGEAMLTKHCQPVLMCSSIVPLYMSPWNLMMAPTWWSSVVTNTSLLTKEDKKIQFHSPEHLDSANYNSPTSSLPPQSLSPSYNTTPPQPNTPWVTCSRRRVC